MSLSSLDLNAPPNATTAGEEPFDFASFCTRLVLGSQLLIAVGCVISFEGYLRTRIHPLGWEESAVRFAHTFRWAFPCMLATSGVFGRTAIWRRVVCVVASCLLAEIVNQVFWGAIVRY